MQNTRDIEAVGTSPQCVVAVFDDWDALHAVLVDLEAGGTMHSGAVLHACKDVPPAASSLNLLKDMAHVHFTQPRQDIACTVGQLAHELSARSATGARGLACALHGWFSSDQAGQLENHIAKGRLVLCLELRTPKEFSEVCGRLVQTSPHMVGLCNIKFDA